MTSGAVWCRCRAKGDEGATLQVEWLKDGVTLNVSTDATSRRFVSANNALVITMAEVEDSGEYTCRASTPFDVASARATLTVREGRNHALTLIDALIQSINPFPAV